MKKTIAALGATLTVVALGAAPACAGLVIDDFSGEQTLQAGPSLANPLSVSGGASDPSILGGGRLAELIRTAGTTPALLYIDLFGNSLLDLQNGGSVSSSLRLTYDGDADGTLEPAGLGGVDLTQGGSNEQFRISARSDVAGSILVRAYTSATDYSEGSVSLPGLGFGGGFSPVELAFAAFTIAGGTGASFSNIGALVFELSGAPGMDVQVDDIVVTAIPEPATALLLLAGLGLAPLAVRRSRPRLV